MKRDPKKPKNLQPDLIGVEQDPRAGGLVWRAHRGPFARNHAWTCDALPGWIVRHCGHPTALRPYFIEGKLAELGVFPRLAEALTAAERAAGVKRRTPSPQIVDQTGRISAAPGTRR